MRVLEFDHVAEKQALVSRLVHEGVRISVLEAEVARCEVVCANCHRRRTARRAGWIRAGGQLSLATLGSPRGWRNAEWVYTKLAKARCVDCDLADTLVLEFDHVGEKRKAVMALAWQEYSLATLEREIAQCEVRCCNCHRRRTLERMNARRSRFQRAV
jgi:hypothetical protein